ncbi:MAG: hypothetical protein ACOYMQ_08690 [Pseudanabaena sp.]|jgi:muramoyltetrapeptide carboxypeptidase LdcA involved in peptidoglycan recycling
MNYQTSRRQFLAGASGAIALTASLTRADETVARQLVGGNLSLVVNRDRFEPLGKPILYNLMFGHSTENALLPLGVKEIA